jgi:hypothetical protein
MVIADDEQYVGTTRVLRHGARARQERADDARHDHEEGAETVHGIPRISAAAVGRRRRQGT